jgi:menaquinone-dependent protoporphyrinogen IX oxidase
MDNKILVAYATKYGATAEIAKIIGEILRENGQQAELVHWHLGKT